jgi:hypothetical protein
MEALKIDEKVTDQYDKSLNCLKEIALALEERLNRGFPEKRILIEVTPGLLANLGQQFNVKLRMPQQAFQDGLFRAYIPLDGLPVSLDLYGEQVVPCKSVEEIQQPDCRVSWRNSGTACTVSLVSTAMTEQLGPAMKALDEVELLGLAALLATFGPGFMLRLEIRIAAEQRQHFSLLGEHAIHDATIARHLGNTMSGGSLSKACPTARNASRRASFGYQCRVNTSSSRCQIRVRSESAQEKRTHGSSP